MIEEINEILVEHFYPVFEGLTDKQIDFVLESEEYITEMKAVKQKVIRDLMLTVKYGNCPKGYKVDTNTKQCVKMTTAEQKLYHKLANHAAKTFKAKGTAAKMIKQRKYDKSMTVRERLNLGSKKKLDFDWKEFNSVEKAGSKFNK